MLCPMEYTWSVCVALWCGVQRKFCKRPKGIYFASITNWSNTFREASIKTFQKKMCHVWLVKNSWRDPWGDEIIRLCSIKREYKSTTQREKTARGERLHIFSTYSICAHWGHVIFQRRQKQILLNFFSAYTHTFFSKSLLAAYLIMIKMLKYPVKGRISCRETVFGHLSLIGKVCSKLR